MKPERSDASPRTEARWTRARFPASGLRDEFLEQIKLWNRIEDLPRILSRETGHHAELEFACADYRRHGLRKLVESYGGKLVSQALQGIDSSSQPTRKAFDAA